MADFSANTGLAYTDADGSIGIGTDTIGVTGVQPSGTGTDTILGYEWGNARPRVKIKGRHTIENMKVTVRMAEWLAYVLAHPNYMDEDVSVSATYNHPSLGPCTVSHDRCSIVKATPSQGTGDSTSGPVYELELLPLSVGLGGVPLT